MPWGIASDRFGNRGVTALGLFLIAVAMAGFATSESEAGLLFWRCAAGVASAAVYVAMAGAIARWFPAREGGFSQATFAGVGGAAGESAAFFLLPVLAICFGVRVAVGDQLDGRGHRCDGGHLPRLPAVGAADAPGNNEKTVSAGAAGRPAPWCYAVVYMGFMIGVRNAQAWTAIYATDVYITAHGST